MNENIIIREYKASDKNELIAIMKLNVPKYFAENELVGSEKSASWNQCFCLFLGYLFARIQVDNALEIFLLSSLVLGTKQYLIGCLFGFYLTGSGLSQSFQSVGYSNEF